MTHLAIGLSNGLTLLLRSTTTLIKSVGNVEIIPPPHYTSKSSNTHSNAFINLACTDRVVETSIEASNSGSICLKLSTVAFDGGNATLPVITGVGLVSSKQTDQVFLWVASTKALRSFNCTLQQPKTTTQRVNITWPLGESKISHVQLGTLLDEQGCQPLCACIGYPSRKKRFTLNHG